MKTLYVTYTENRTGGQPLGDGPYCDYEDINIDWYITDCYINPPPKNLWEREVITADFPIKTKDTIYLVYIRYNTGNTFGKIIGEWSIIGIYQTQKDAEQMQQEVKNTKSPFIGYFEQITECEILPLIVV